jgi:hypothetical protein
MPFEPDSLFRRDGRAGLVGEEGLRSVLMLKQWQWRQILRKDSRLFIDHIRTESDPKQNEQLRQSYDQHPLRLAAVIVADIFVDGEIEVLWAALRGPIGPDRLGAEDARKVRDFLRRSASRTLGGAALGAIRFHKSGQHRMGFGSHELRLPEGVERLSLHLYQFAPGMVMAAIVAAMPSTTAEKVFHESHASPVSLERGGGVSFKFVETAKGADLEHQFRAVAEVGLLPPHTGLLGDHRYPSGCVVVWTGSTPSDDEAPSWRDVGQVFGIETWQWWEGEDVRLYSGVPEPVREIYERGGGYTMLDTRQQRATDEGKEFGGPEGLIRYELELEIHTWLPLLLLVEAAREITDTAGRLRERLNRRGAAPLGLKLPIIRLGKLVAALHTCQYRLERLRQAADLDDKRAFRDFPGLVFRSAHTTQERLTQSLLDRLERLARKQPPADEPARQLRNSAIEWLDRLTKTGLQDVGLSLEKARLLAQLRSSAALVLWSALVGILTAILVVRELTR